MLPIQKSCTESVLMKNTLYKWNEFCDCKHISEIA